MTKSTFRVLQLSGDGESPWLASDRPWVPSDTYMIRADQLARGDFLAWSPAYTYVQFAVMFGTKVQVSTRDYGMLILPGGLMVMVNRVEVSA
jgi:hypothetical protein